MVQQQGWQMTDIFGTALSWITAHLEWLREPPETRPATPLPSPDLQQFDSSVRGERNNNPGNLDYDPAIPYKGQLGVEIVPPGYAYRARFARFDTSRNGLRALARWLM